MHVADFCNAQTLHKEETAIAAAPHLQETCHQQRPCNSRATDPAKAGSKGVKILLQALILVLGASKPRRTVTVSSLEKRKTKKFNVLA
mmetsp:Transcript_917/g.1725  ORF Transcript_917/g.1725 Transcript_917/m.1725 type:complete len:88 (+) Transcript_917:143-406(+)